MFDGLICTLCEGCFDFLNNVNQREPQLTLLHNGAHATEGV